MFFELREYHTKPGQLSRWIRFMDEEIIPFQISKGMDIIGSFSGRDGHSLYVWIRRFNSESERIKQYKDVYDDTYWKTNIEPNITEMLSIEKAKVTDIISTECSPIK